MIKSLFITSLISLFFFFTLNAQSNLDSLYLIWEDETLTDSTRTKAFVDYIWDGFLYSDSDSAFVLTEELLDFGKSHQYSKAEAEAYNTQGVVFWLKGDYPRSLDAFKGCFDVRKEIGDRKGMAGALNGIGNIYYSLGNYPKALESHQRSLKIKEELKDKKGIAQSLNNIGNVYIALSDYPNALEYYQESLEMKEELGDENGMAMSLGNIGIIYYEQGDFQKALEYYQRSLKIKEKQNGDKSGLANALLNIGNIYSDQGDYELAIDYFQRSLKVNETSGDKRATTNALLNIGNVYFDQGRYNEAILEYQKSLTLAKEIEAITRQKNACNRLYEIHKHMGHGSKALDYHEQLTILNDSLFNEENTKKLTQLEMQYDFDKKEAATQMEQEKKDVIALQELKQRKLERNGFIGGFAVMLLFAGVFFRQRNRIGKEKDRSEKLLMNILPKEVAEELKNKGHSDAQLIDHVTVLFTDFKDFTKMSENMTPKELVSDLHACFSEFDLICDKNGVEKIKTIGDAYMAAGGLPIPNATHAKDVVNAALEMSHVVEVSKAKNAASKLPFFEVRIGVHTGPVVAGIVGVKKFQYDIWGDTVNTASRMESSGQVGKVNISNATYELLKGDPQFNFENRGKITAKGKGEMDMWFVSKK